VHLTADPRSCLLAQPLSTRRAATPSLAGTGRLR